MKKTKFVLIVLGVMLGLLAINMLLPTKIQNPVEGCGKESYHPKSFWLPQGDWHQDPKFLLFFINPIKEMER